MIEFTLLPTDQANAKIDIAKTNLAIAKEYAPRITNAVLKSSVEKQTTDHSTNIESKDKFASTIRRRSDEAAVKNLTAIKEDYVSPNPAQNPAVSEVKTSIKDLKGDLQKLFQETEDMVKASAKLTVQVHEGQSIDNKFHMDQFKQQAIKQQTSTPGSHS
jgi:hypothetical protein